MPELFGVVVQRGIPLPARALEGFMRLSRGIRCGSESHLETVRESWANIHLLKHHATDPGLYVRRAEQGCSMLWAGRTSAVMPDLDPSELIGEIEEGTAQAILDGEPPFCCCLLDSNRQRVRLVSDRYGFQPLYYKRSSALLAFSTRLGPLLGAEFGHWNLDPRAVLDFFTYEYVTGDRTFAEEVKLLAPGTVLTFDEGGLETRSYVEEEIMIDTSLTIDDLAHGLHHELLRSVQSSVERSERLAITLSGGLDSRAILGCAMGTAKRVQTYTFGTPQSRDVKYAAELARRSHSDHDVVRIDHTFLPKWIEYATDVTGGMVGSIHFHILSLAEILGADADLVLDGLGGDALTGGHLKWSMLLPRSAEKTVEAAYLVHATAFPTAEARDLIFERDFLESVDYDPRTAIREHFPATGDGPTWWGCHRFDLSERQRRFIQFGPHLLRPFVGVDTPFYSNPLVDLVKRAPASLLIEQRAYLRMQTRYIPELARVPDTARGVPLAWPHPLRFGKHVVDYVWRKVGGASGGAPIDYANWFAGPLEQFLNEQLIDGGSCMDGIIRRDGVKAVLDDHVSGRADRTVQIGCILAFANWLRSLLH